MEEKKVNVLREEEMDKVTGGVPVFANGLANGLANNMAAAWAGGLADALAVDTKSCLAILVDGNTRK